MCGTLTAHAEERHWVNGYYRKNGTYVSGYYRGGGVSTSKSRSSSKSSKANIAREMALLQQLRQPLPPSPPPAPLTFPPLEPSREPSWIREQKLEKSLGLQARVPAQSMPKVVAPKAGTPQAITFPFVGRCVEVLDGNRLRVARNGAVLTVWLAGVYAPDLKQSFGTQAKTSLTSLALGKTVTLYDASAKQKETRRAWVFAGATSINKEQLKRGMAWWDNRQFPTDTKLSEIEQTARTTSLGLWSEANPSPPWDWKQAHPS